MAKYLCVCNFPNPASGVIPISGIPWDDGMRAVLSVRGVWAKLQTTILWENSLYMIWYDIGQLTKQDGFKAFLKPYFGTRCQRVNFPNRHSLLPRLCTFDFQVYQSSPRAPVALGTVTS